MEINAYPTKIDLSGSGFPIAANVRIMETEAQESYKQFLANITQYILDELKVEIIRVQREGNGQEICGAIPDFVKENRKASFINILSNTLTPMGYMVKPAHNQDTFTVSWAVQAPTPRANGKVLL